MATPSFTPEDRLAVAEAVAFDSRGIEIDANNVNVRHGSLRDLVAGDACYTTQVASRLLAVDLDDIHAVPAFDALLKALWTAGIDPLVCLSGGGSHRRHLFVPAPTGRRRTAWRIALQARGLDVRLSMRPPLTKHRSAGRSVPEVPLDASEILTKLVSVDQATAQAKWSVAGQVLGGAAALSDRMLRVLHLGHSGSGYRSPSEGRMALAAAVYGTGGTDTEVVALLDEPGFALGDSWRRRGARWRDQELTRLREKAMAYLQREAGTQIMTRDDAVDAVSRWRGAVDAKVTHGRTAATLLAVAEGLAMLASKRGGPRFVASFDEIAIEAGVSRDTAKRSMDALTKSKLVRRDLVGGGRFAPLWVLLGRGERTGAPLISLACDTARWAGLGKTTVRIARLLSTEPVRPATIGTQIGIGNEGVRRHLRKLRDAGIVEQQPDGWALTGSIEAAAHTLGTDGMREEQSAALQERRDQRQALRATWAKDNDTAATS